MSEWTANELIWDKNMPAQNTQCPLAMNFAFPDSDVVPPAVVPSMNVANLATAIPTVPNIFVNCMPVHNMLTMEPATVGSVGPGVASGTACLTSTHTFGSTLIFYICIPATRLLDPTIQNLTNAPGATLIPCQVLLWIFR